MEDIMKCSKCSSINIELTREVKDLDIHGERVKEEDAEPVIEAKCRDCGYYTYFDFPKTIN